MVSDARTELVDKIVRMLATRLTISKWLGSAAGIAGLAVGAGLFGLPAIVALVPGIGGAIVASAALKQKLGIDGFEKSLREAVRSFTPDQLDAFARAIERVGPTVTPKIIESMMQTAVRKES